MPAHKPEDCDILLIEAVHRGDLEAAMALYEPNASFVLDSGQIITGRDAIREIFRASMADKPRFTLAVKSVKNGDGDVALTSATWSVTGVGADGKPYSNKGKSAEVVRRQPDGTWLFVIDNPHGGE